MSVRENPRRKCAHCIASAVAYMLFGCGYSSQKYIRIHDWRLGVLHRCLQMVIIGYVVFYMVLYKQGYQDKDSGVSAVVSKVKGSGPGVDAHDLVKPGLEDGAIFVTTFLETFPEQSKRTSAHHLETDQPWCPTEVETNPTVEEYPCVENWTLFIRADIKFTRYDVAISNSAEGSGPTRGLNLFTIKDIVEGSGTNVSHILHGGAVILISASFQCNLDFKHEDCHPSYTFTRLDSVKSGSFSSGFNFREVEYISNTSRVIRKRHGLRLLLHVSGVGRKFSITVLSTTIGAGIALLGLASVAVDMVMQYLVDRRKSYSRLKYQSCDTDVISNEEAEEMSEILSN